jgi:PAS domain S-box-containing protein
MMLGISIALLLLQCLSSYVVIENFRAAILESVNKQQFALVTTLGHEIDDRIEGHRRRVDVMAKLTPPDVFVNGKRARTFLDEHADTLALFDHGLFLLTADGRLAAELPFRSKSRLGLDFSYRAHIKEVILTHRPVVSQPYASSINSEPVVMFLVPVLKADGTLSGIIGGVVDLLGDNFLGNIAQAKIGSSGYLYLFGRDRTMIVHPDRSRMLAKDVAPGVNVMFDRAIGGFEGSGETVNSRGVRSVSSFKRLKTVPWVLAVNLPASEAYAPLKKAIRNLSIAISLSILGVSLALHQIGIRMRREVAGRTEAENYASMLIESVGEGVIGIAQDATIRFVNGEGLALLGYDSAQELLGRDARQVLHHAYSACPDCPQQQCRLYPPFVANLPQRLENLALSRKDGSSFAAEFSCTPVGSGTMLHGAVMTFRDISEQVAIRERLRLQSAALEAAANSILITDVRGTIIWVNNSFIRQTGYARDEAVGQHPIPLLSGRDDEELFRELRKTIYDKKAWQGELLTRRKDGSTYDEAATVTPVLNELGEITHFIGIRQDVSERKRGETALLQSNLALEEANRQFSQLVERANQMAEIAEQASAAKSEFLANMSHEIRTPMNGIIGSSHLLRDTPLSAQQKDYLQTLSTSAESLLEIINGIMDFSSIEAGSLVIDRVEFSPQQVIAEVAVPFAARAKEKGLKLHTELDEAIPTRLLGDPRHLTQILNNLLSNALKFTRAGFAALTVIVTRQSADGVELEFTVQDTGIGMRSEDQEHLFQAFTQVDGSKTRTYGGTGLGLAVSHRLTELMGGADLVREYARCRQHLLPAPSLQLGHGGACRLSAARLPARCAFWRSTDTACRGQHLQPESGSGLSGKGGSHGRGSRQWHASRAAGHGAGLRPGIDGRSDADHGRTRGSQGDPETCQARGR